MLAIMGFAKIQGDEAVLDDIDRHFDAFANPPPASPPTAAAAIDTPHVAGRQVTSSVADTAPTRSQREQPSRQPIKKRHHRKKRAATQNRAVSTTNWPGIRRVSPATFEINPPLAEAARKTPMKFVRGVAAKLTQKDGLPIGFRLSGIRPGSALFALGLANGDVLLGVNGFALKSIEEAILAAGAAKFADKFRVDILRRGRKHAVYYRVVPF